MANNKFDDKKNDDKKNKDSGLADTLKKIITSGSASEISKELAQTVIGQVVKTKDDITLKATQEMITLIQKIDFVKEFSKFAQNHKFKITAEVEIFKKEDPEKK